MNITVEPIYRIDYEAIYDKYCDIAKVTLSVFKNRVEKWNMDLQKALTTPDIDYKKIAEHNDIPYRTFRRRVKDYGWTIEEACVIPTKVSSYVREKSNINIQEELIKSILVVNGWNKLTRIQMEYVLDYKNEFDDYL